MFPKVEKSFFLLRFWKAAPQQAPELMTDHQYPGTQPYMSKMVVMVVRREGQFMTELEMNVSLLHHGKVIVRRSQKGNDRLSLLIDSFEWESYLTGETKDIVKPINSHSSQNSQTTLMKYFNPYAAGG